MIKSAFDLKRRVAALSTLLAFVATAIVGPLATTVNSAVDTTIPTYKKSGAVSGSLNSVGSDTMNNLLKFWGEAFRSLHPGVNVQVEGKGSSTAPPALIASSAQLAPMSREMKSTEIDDFQKKYGFKPTPIRTSLDAIALYVNKDNPLTEITLDQVDGIFSSTHKRGGADISKWSDLGLTGEWGAKPISAYGRNSASGTYGYFKDHALNKGDYKNTVKEQPGSASVVEGVSGDRYSIGYTGIGYSTSGVKELMVANKTGDTAKAPTAINVYAGDYPLARYLYIYIVKNPSRPLEPAVKEFLRFVLSKAGQEIVEKAGYMPLPANIAQKELAKLD